MLGLSASSALTAAAASADAPKPPVLAPGCAQTLAFEKTAAADGIAPQAALDAANAGLEANRRCGDPVMHPVNEAFLLSLRAMARYALHDESWRTDFRRANELLAQCEARRDKAGAPANAVCKTQEGMNQTFLAQYAPPTAAPGSSATASLPAPLVAPVNPPGMVASPVASATPATIGPVPPPPRR
jgi:hypothetical protein